MSASVWAARLARQSPRYFSLLYTGTTTETRAGAFSGRSRWCGLRDPNRDRRNGQERLFGEAGMASESLAGRDVTPGPGRVRLLP